MAEQRGMEFRKRHSIATTTTTYDYEQRAQRRSSSDAYIIAIASLVWGFEDVGIWSLAVVNEDMSITRPVDCLVRVLYYSRILPV